jgi:hypothetical protein
MGSPTLRTDVAVEIRAGAHAEAPGQGHPLDPPALADLRRGVVGLDALDPELLPLVHDRFEPPPGHEKGEWVGDHGDAAGRLDQAQRLFKLEASLGLIKGPPLREEAVEGLLPGPHDAARDEEGRDMRPSGFALPRGLL